MQKSRLRHAHRLAAFTMNLADAALSPDEPVPSSSRRAWVEPLLLACALIAWFGYDLGTRALWSPDEGRYAEIPRAMVESGDYVTPRLNGVKYFEKPPLVYWLTAGSIKAFGLNEWALRLWPALFAVLGCLTVYFVGRRLYGRRTGMLAAGVLATAPLYHFMGDVLTLDMPVSALLTIALGAFLLGVRSPTGMTRRLLLYAFYASAALAVLAKGLIGIVLPSLIIGAWMMLLGEWRLLRAIHLLGGALIFLAIAVPWHVLAARANPEFASFYFIHEHLERYLTTVHHRYQPPWFFVPVLLAGLYPWLVFLPQALRARLPGIWRERRRYADRWFLILWAAVPFLFFSASNSKLIPYILPVVPPLALLLGRWLALASEQPGGLPRAPFIVLLALGIAVSAGFAFAGALAPDNPKVVEITGQLGAGQHLMAGALLLAGVIPLFARYRYAPWALASVIIGAAVVVAIFDLNLARLDVGRSAKGLALTLKPALRAGDEVMVYREYYQDLPVYLERRVTVVDWKGELEFGTTVEDTGAWMIDEPAFRRRWTEPRTIYLLTSRDNYAELLARPPGPMCQLDSTSRVVILVNRGCGA